MNTKMIAIDSVSRALDRIVESAGIDPTPYRFEAVNLDDGNVLVTFQRHRHDPKVGLSTVGKMVLLPEEAEAVAAEESYTPPVLLKTIGKTLVSLIGSNLPALPGFEVENIVALVAAEGAEDRRRASIKGTIAR